MNNIRRSQIAKLKSQLEEVRDALSDLCTEEQEYYDNMPESIQESEKGDAAQTAADALQSACDEIDSAVSELDTATE